MWSFFCHGKFVGFVAACTPLGVSRMFTVMGELIVKPKVSSRDTVSLSYCALGDENVHVSVMGKLL